MVVTAPTMNPRISADRPVDFLGGQAAEVGGAVDAREEVGHVRSASHDTSVTGSVGGGWRGAKNAMVVGATPGHSRRPPAMATATNPANPAMTPSPTPRPQVSAQQADDRGPGHPPEVAGGGEGADGGGGPAGHRGHMGHQQRPEHRGTSGRQGQPDSGQQPGAGQGFEQQARAGDAGPGDHPQPGTDPTQARAPQPTGEDGDALSEAVGGGADQRGDGQMGPEIEDAPGVDAAFDDFGGGEDRQQHDEAIGTQLAQGPDEGKVGAVVAMAFGGHRLGGDGCGAPPGSGPRRRRAGR